MSGERFYVEREGAWHELGGIVDVRIDDGRIRGDYQLRMTVPWRETEVTHPWHETEIPEGTSSFTLEAVAEAFDVPLDFVRECCVTARQRERERRLYREQMLRWQRELLEINLRDYWDFSVSQDAHRVAAIADAELGAWADFIAEVKK